jgi:hypothetical protein
VKPKEETHEELVFTQISYIFGRKEKRSSFLSPLNLSVPYR